MESHHINLSLHKRPEVPQLTWTAVLPLRGSQAPIYSRLKMNSHAGAHGHIEIDLIAHRPTHTKDLC